LSSSLDFSENTTLTEILIEWQEQLADSFKALAMAKVSLLTELERQRIKA